MKKIAVICGAGIATSTYIQCKIESLCEENNIPVQISKGMLLEAEQLVHGADFIVATVEISKNYGIPVINGVPLLTGIGQDETIKKILDELNK